MQSIIAPKVANAYSKIDFILKKKMRVEADLYAILQFSFQIREMIFCYQNCSSDREKLLKFEVEGREFSKFLRSLEQFIQTV